MSARATWSTNGNSPYGASASLANFLVLASETSNRTPLEAEAESRWRLVLARSTDTMSSAPWPVGLDCAGVAVSPAYTAAGVTVNVPGALPLRITTSSKLPGPPPSVRPSAAQASS